MAGYAPRHLPDETLYSLLARTAEHRGIESAGTFMSEIFGRRHVISSFDLQGHLSSLSEWFADHPDFDIDSIIDQLTLFPFHTAYASAQRRQAARAGMAGAMTGVHTSLGLNSFRVPAVRSLRFCPACTVEWDATGQEWHWRRSHQLPGALVCADHGEPLHDSAVSLNGKNRHRFVAASRATCLEMSTPIMVTEDALCRDRLGILARAARSLLENPPPAMEPEELVERYRERLSDVGLMRSARNVDQAALETEFMLFWGRVLEVIPGLVRGGTPAGGWLMALVRTRARAAHPLLHLLLTLFLDLKEPVNKPFGTGPWPCRNPFAPHSGEAVIKTIDIRRDREMRYGDFRCSCGYHYTCSLSPSGVVGPPRYRAFGPLFEPALARFVSEGSSLRSAARACRLDAKTLMREALTSGISVPWSTRPSGTPRRISSGGSPRPIIRVRKPAPSPKRSWGLIDRRLERAAKKAVKEIQEAEPVARVTVAEIERRIASSRWVARRRLRLPRTWNMIHRSLETVDQFRLRRLNSVARQLAVEAPDSTASDVLRAAGLPMSWLPFVRALLVQQPATLVRLRQ